MNKIFLVTSILIIITSAPLCFACNNVISGYMDSYINVLDSSIFVITETGCGIYHFSLRFYRYMNYQFEDPDPVCQRIFIDSFLYEPDVTMIMDQYDSAGNWNREPVWGYLGGEDTLPPGEYKTTIMADLQSYVFLDGIADTTCYPVASSSIPWYVQRYLDPTDSIQSDDESLQAYAESLVANSKLEVQAVCKIMDWIADSIQPRSEPEYAISALSVLNDPQHRANCTGIARLAIAFLRSVGIPARYVTGYVIDDTTKIPRPGNVDSVGISFGQGYHAWIEVYYPGDGKWIPYDFGYYHFVDSHRYREAVGVDIGLDLYGYHILKGVPTWSLKLPGYPWPTCYYRWSYNSEIGIEFCNLTSIDSLPTPDLLVFSDKISGATGIKEDFVSNDKKNNSFYVEQNFPNPFNNETIIEYRIPEETEMVNLSIYNVLGQKVRTLINERKNPGIYRIHWYGRNDKDQEVSSGIYFYTIKIGKFSDSKIMVFQK